MPSCSHCNKEVSLGQALLTQDLEAKPLAFCSGECHETWWDNQFTPLASTAASAAAA
jgi:hypothetical protein